MPMVISHRGNLRGPNPERENSPEYIQEALDAICNVEIDVWGMGGDIYLGHDKPTYKINDSFLMERQLDLWCHAKNIEALQILYSLGGPEFFWHQTDDFTLTSSGYIWTYPGKPLTKKSICVLPEQSPDPISHINICAGICSDYIATYRKNI